MPPRTADTDRTINELDSVDLFDGEPRLGEGLLEWKGDAMKEERGVLHRRRGEAWIKHLCHS